MTNPENPLLRSRVSRQSQIGYWPWRRIFFGLLLLWIIVLLVSSRSKSTVLDEPPHIVAGLTYWKFGDFRMNPEHPPLVKMLSVLPSLLLDNIPVVYETKDYYVSSWFDSDQYRFGYHVLFRSPINPKEVVFHCRIVPVLIGALGAFLAFLWGKRLAGGVAGGAASALCLMIYPEYAGHSRFVTLDVPTLVACSWISLAAHDWWRRPALRNGILFGMAVGIGSLVKLPVSVFSVFVMLTLFGLKLMAGPRIKAVAWVKLVLVILAGCYLLAWASAGFRFFINNPDMPLTRRSEYAPAYGNYGYGAFAELLSFLWRYRLLPETTLAVISHVRSFEIRNYYFLGQWAPRGWYSYFFVTMALKTSLLMLAAYAAAIITWVAMLVRMPRDRRRLLLGKLIILVVPFLLLFGVFVAGRANLGHRYVMFIYMPLSILLGTAMMHWWVRSKGGRMITGLLAFYFVFAFARQYPNYETYFNEIIRTPYRAMPYLGDSNIDWGQDMPLLGKEYQAFGVREMNMAFFGAGRPGAYGIGKYRWILPNYPFSVFQMDEAVQPDTRLMSGMSLNGLMAARSLYPGLYDHDPEIISNSVVVFLPKGLTSKANP